MSGANVYFIGSFCFKVWFIPKIRFGSMFQNLYESQPDEALFISSLIQHYNNKGFINHF